MSRTRDEGWSRQTIGGQVDSGLIDRGHGHDGQWVPPDERGQEITHWLRAWGRGEPGAEDRLIPLVYGELRKIAAGLLARERPEHTLQPTALVNEAYLRLVEQQHLDWQCRTQFYALAARMVQRILVDHARRVVAVKRGRGQPRVPLDEVTDLALERPDQLLALDQALASLRQRDPFKADIVQYRFFAGLSHGEAATVLGCSEITVKRHWRLAKAWLFHELSQEAGNWGATSG